MEIGRNPNHTCRICGQKYWACDNCDRKIGIEWRAAACCEEHYHLYFLVWDYDNPGADKALARKELREAGADKWEASPCREKILEILADEENEPVPAKPVMEVKAEDAEPAKTERAEAPAHQPEAKREADNRAVQMQNRQHNNHKKNDWKKR